MRNLIKLAFTLIVLVMLASCAARPPARDSIAALPSLESGWARLYFSAGVIDMPYRPNVDARFNHQLGPVFVDEVNVGSPANGEYIVVDVKAGSHTLRWQPHEQAEKLESVVEQINLSSGQTKYFACDTKVFNVAGYSGLSASGLAFGAIGGAVSQIGDKPAIEKSARGVLVEKNQIDSSSKLVGYFKYDEASVSKKPSTKDSGSNLDNTDRLKQLQKMRKDGVISEREYQRKRTEILNQI